MMHGQKNIKLQGRLLSLFLVLCVVTLATTLLLVSLETLILT